MTRTTRKPVGTIVPIDVSATLGRHYAGERHRGQTGGPLCPETIAAASLWIGGGRLPTAFVEVAEIDPGVTDAATAALWLRTSELLVRGGPGAEVAPRRSGAEPPEGSSIQVYHLDARNRVDELETMQERAGGLTFTDDYAPVENLLARVK